MAEYYLMSQLPSLDAVGENTLIPITEERFLELCYRFLGKKDCDDLKRLTLLPPKHPEKLGSPLLEGWSKGERNLRLALGKIRAEKMKKPFDMENNTISAELIKVAKTAVELEIPMEAEKFLNSYRLEFLECLRPADNFSKEMVFYYGLKLKLLLRIRQFDEASGETAYKNIYNSIMNDDKTEATQ